MNQEEFVKIVKLLAEESVLKSIEENWAYPPGKNPSKNLLEISEWYNKLDGNSKNKLRLAIQDAIHHSVFGFFAIIDGVRKSTELEGHYELYFVTPKTRYLLNDLNEELLHDIYNSL